MKRFLKAFVVCAVMLSGCQQSGNGDSVQLREAHRDEVTQLSGIPYFRDWAIVFGCEYESSCKTGTMIVGQVDQLSSSVLRTREQFVCALNQVEFQQSIFSKIAVINIHHDEMGVNTSSTQFEVPLPVTTGMR